MNIDKFKAGTLKKQYEYSSFSPELVSCFTARRLRLLTVRCGTREIPQGDAGSELRLLNSRKRKDCDIYGNRFLTDQNFTRIK